MHITFVLWTAVYEISMNKTIALAAITLVAVIMGLSSFAPAAMATPSEERGNGTHNPKVKWCHFDRDSNDDGDTTTNDRTWEVLRLNKHSEAAHIAHGDLAIPGVVSEVDCDNNVPADPDAP